MVVEVQTVTGVEGMTMIRLLPAPAASVPVSPSRLSTAHRAGRLRDAEGWQLAGPLRSTLRRIALVLGLTAPFAIPFVVFHAGEAAAVTASEVMAVEVDLAADAVSPASLAAAVTDALATQNVTLSPRAAAALGEASRFSVQRMNEDEDEVDELLLELVVLALDTAMPYVLTALEITVNLVTGHPDNDQYVRLVGACQAISVYEQAGNEVGPGQLSVCTFDPNQLADAIASEQLGSGVGQLLEMGIYGNTGIVDPTAPQMEPSVISTKKSTYRPGQRFVSYFVSCLYLESTTGRFEPYNSCPIEIAWSVQAGSGEHDHGGARPRGRVEIPAIDSDAQNAAETVYANPDYNVSPVSAGEVVPPVTGAALIQTTTAADNNALDYSYVAPEASGLTKFSLTGFKGTEYNPITIDKDITVEVAGLVGQNGYTGPNGASWSMKPNSASPHNNKNFFATEALLGRLDNVAEVFESLLLAFLQPPTTPRPVVTELSLPNGGLFDLHGGSQPYQPPHKTHRRGEAADIRIRDFSNLQVVLMDASIRASGLRMPVPHESIGTCAAFTDPNAANACTTLHFHAEADLGAVSNNEQIPFE